MWKTFTPYKLGCLPDPLLVVSSLYWLMRSN